MVRILVCGNRDWRDKCLIQKALNICMEKYGEFHLIHGNCRGADKLAGDIASNAMEMITTAVPARWDKYGKRAGPERNLRMLLGGKPNFVLAFCVQGRVGQGSGHTLSVARSRGIPAFLIHTEADLNNLYENLP